MSTKTVSPVPEERSLRARQVLQEYAAVVDGLHMALLTTPDGFELACVNARSGLQTNRLAAMASSLVAMGRAVGREIQSAPCTRLVFEAPDRQVIFQAVEGAFPCILCLVLETDAVLGRALWAASRISLEMGRD